MSDTRTMRRPGIDEFDTGSYLDASLMPHDVIGHDAEGVTCDGSPNFDFEAFNIAPSLCEEHSYDLARSLGFSGPIEMNTSYQRWLPFKAEQVMVRYSFGTLVQVAAYTYGRAYFKPGEPRTMPCDVCGVETLVDA